MTFPHNPYSRGQTRITARVTATLRLLETTDLHANLLPYDYFSGLGSQPYGLARIATLIRAARSECPNTLLFDNGDALQGTPMADITAQDHSGWVGPHPVILAMNLMNYDAATLGNHDFNFGLDWLMRVLSHSAFPITCANILVKGKTPLLPPFLLLDRLLQDDTGQSAPIRIGVTGLVPPQITTWDQSHLKGRLTSHDMLYSARQIIPDMRAAGADLVVVLAHTGIESGPARPLMENAALQLAHIAGIDAILTGHTHRIFPDPTSPPQAGIDSVKGTLNGLPSVMAGFRGSHLGVLDLKLIRQAGKWNVISHHAGARPVVPSAGDNTPPAQTDPTMAAALVQAHHLTVELTTLPIGHSPAPLHSYLAMIQCSAPIRLVAQAQHAALQAALRDTGMAETDLPILSASAPFKTGGHGGPQHYTDIPAGRLSMRHAADLSPFPNTLCGIRMSGARLRDWLERAVIGFNQIHPGVPNQILCNPSIPGHIFDTIYGLSYHIDVSQPPRFALDGTLSDPDARRITGLSYQSVPVQDSDQFILATNSYRASGGVPFRAPPKSAFIHIGTKPIRDIIVDYIRTADQLEAWQPIWHLADMPGTDVLFDTGPGLRKHPQDIARIGAKDCGNTDEGFIRLSIPL